MIGAELDAEFEKLRREVEYLREGCVVLDGKVEELKALVLVLKRRINDE